MSNERKIAAAPFMAQLRSERSRPLFAARRSSDNGLTVSRQPLHSSLIGEMPGVV